jgi:hypothetical protein
MRESIENALEYMFGHPVSPTGNWFAAGGESLYDLGPKDQVSPEEAQRKALALGAVLSAAPPFVKRRKVRKGKRPPLP